jgi:hypothetical protein
MICKLDTKEGFFFCPSGQFLKNIMLDRPRKNRFKLRKSPHKVKSVPLKTKFKFNVLFNKKLKKYFIFLPAFYLIMWLMTSAIFFEKIATLKK